MSSGIACGRPEHVVRHKAQGSAGNCGFLQATGEAGFETAETRHLCCSRHRIRRPRRPLLHTCPAGSTSPRIILITMTVVTVSHAYLHTTCNQLELLANPYFTVLISGASPSSPVRRKTSIGFIALGYPRLSRTVALLLLCCCVGALACDSWDDTCAQAAKDGTVAA